MHAGHDVGGCVVMVCMCTVVQCACVCKHSCGSISKDKKGKVRRDFYKYILACCQKLDSGAHCTTCAQDLGTRRG